MEESTIKGRHSLGGTTLLDKMVQEMVKVFQLGNSIYEAKAFLGLSVIIQDLRGQQFPVIWGSGFSPEFPI